MKIYSIEAITNAYARALIVYRAELDNAKRDQRCGDGAGILQTILLIDVRPVVARIKIAEGTVPKPD